MTSPPSSAFEYSSLAVEQIEVLRKAANRIRRGVRTTIEAIFIIGNDLLAAKALLGHGQFNNWVRAECGFSPRTAERFMRVVVVLGSKCDTVSFLQPRTIYKLTAKGAPSEVVKAVVERLGSDRPVSDVEVIEMIDRNKFSKRERRTVHVLPTPLAAAWTSASVSEREALIALDPQAHLATAWLLLSKEAQAKFVRDRWDEIESPLSEIDTPDASKDAPVLLSPDRSCGAGSSRQTPFDAEALPPNLADGIPDFLRRREEDTSHEQA